MQPIGHFLFDQEQALEYRGGNIEYQPAYPTTNEAIRWELNQVPPTGAQVLTVAASGDQPIFYKAAGAAHVDTFDITYCARLIMDLKTYALRVLDSHQYNVMLSHLENLATAADRPELWTAISQMPQRESGLITKMILQRPRAFGRGIAYNQNMPRPYEYQRMRNTIDKPFNFIWSDIENVHKYLHQKYDIINISNIIDYVKRLPKIYNIISGLLPHLNAGGKIILTSSDCSNELLKRFISKYPPQLGQSTTVAVFDNTQIRNNPLGFCAITITKTR